MRTAMLPWVVVAAVTIAGAEDAPAIHSDGGLTYGVPPGFTAKVEASDDGRRVAIACAGGADRSFAIAWERVPAPERPIVLARLDQQRGLQTLAPDIGGELAWATHRQEGLGGRFATLSSFAAAGAPAWDCRFEAVDDTGTELLTLDAQAQSAEAAVALARLVAPTLAIAGRAAFARVDVEPPAADRLPPAEVAVPAGWSAHEPGGKLVVPLPDGCRETVVGEQRHWLTAGDPVAILAGRLDLRAGRQVSSGPAGTVPLTTLAEVAQREPKALRRSRHEWRAGIGLTTSALAAGDGSGGVATVFEIDATDDAAGEVVGVRIMLSDLARSTSIVRGVLGGCRRDGRPLITMDEVDAMIAAAASATAGDVTPAAAR